MEFAERKQLGAYYTPDDVVRSLVRWATRSTRDRMLDPACGDGRFLTAHPHSVGVEQDRAAALIVHQRSPGSLIHEGDFFTWAAETKERFDCAAGNPPFIRYQRFTGAVRAAATSLCASHGAHFSGLSSSWAPFIVATASLLRRGGRLAFVVPAEIGHAPYAKPLLDFLVSHFAHVQLVAVRERLFSDLSEDCWLLYAAGFGEQAQQIHLSPLDFFAYMPNPPSLSIRVGLKEWQKWNSRLRPFLLSAAARDLYAESLREGHAFRLGDAARVGIGYVTGANDFFHLRPSDADRAEIPRFFLQPSVRNGGSLPPRAVTASTVAEWIRRDEPVLLLRLHKDSDVPRSVKRYLDSPAGLAARQTYKCRTRDPWFVVPDVSAPDGFLSYMSGNGPSLVSNHTDCACTNSVHAVRLLDRRMSMGRLRKSWDHPFTRLSCEVEGHPLGGGMLKLEPGEASRIALVTRERWTTSDQRLIRDGIDTMCRWRHCG